MTYIKNIAILICLVTLVFSCKNQINPVIKNDAVKEQISLSAKDILGNPDYLAISYGGYRAKTRDSQPSIKHLKEDMKLLSAIGIKVLRTYNVQLPHAGNVAEAISQLKREDPDFEMYMMLGAWIDCKNAWTGKTPDHDVESEQNEGEIARAVALANKYPDIIKIIAVGNEAMVKWAAMYYVQPKVILKWVNHLQDLKLKGELPKDLWITSSDNFASWGGGESQYHGEDLNNLIKSVDYISMHTYPMHDTHYNPSFWGIKPNEQALSDKEKIKLAMIRSKDYAVSQYKSVVKYVHAIDSTKTVHIGETGWASSSNDLFGSDGSRAADEYKEALFYDLIREWSNKNRVSCFYFEAFNEQWKDAQNHLGSENYFGLFTLDGKAKFALWDFVDAGVFDGLKRNGNKITKTYDGNLENLMKDVMVPPTEHELMAH